MAHDTVQPVRDAIRRLLTLVLRVRAVANAEERERNVHEVECAVQELLRCVEEAEAAAAGLRRLQALTPEGRHKAEQKEVHVLKQRIQEKEDALECVETCIASWTEKLNQLGRQAETVEGSLYLPQERPEP